MNFDQWASLAVQIPIVVAFIVHSTWMTRTFLTHLEVSGKMEREQRQVAMAQGLREVEALCRTIEGIIEQLKLMQTSMHNHEAGALARHAALLERIKGNEHGNDRHN